MGEFYRRVREYNEEHPADFETWRAYFSLYRPMVTENSVAYVELSECDEVLSPLGDKIIASMFVNEEIYLVVSNLSGAPYQLKLKEQWHDRVSGTVSSEISVNHEQILFLKKE